MCSSPTRRLATTHPPSHPLTHQPLLLTLAHALLPLLQLTDEAFGDNPCETKTRDEAEILPNDFYPDNEQPGRSNK